MTAGNDTVPQEHTDGSKQAQLQGQVVPTAVQADDSDAAALLQLQGQHKTPAYQGIGNTTLSGNSNINSVHLLGIAACFACQCKDVCIA